MFPSLAHLVVGQTGSRHNVEADYESNLSRRGPLDKMYIFCPNPMCKHHLKFKLSSKALLLKCPVCMKTFNPYKPIIIQCTKCKTKNSTPLYNQIIQCANKNCKRIINCWPVFRIEKYKDLEKKKNNYRHQINLDSDEDNGDDDDDVKIIERNNNNNQNTNNNNIEIIELKDDENSDNNNDNSTKREPKPETFLLVKESEIGAYTNYKKKNKLYSQQKIIRMEHEQNGLVVIINDNNQFKQRQIPIKEPKVYRSPFEWYFIINVNEWQIKYPNDNKMQLLHKMITYWKDEETEDRKKSYIKMSKDDEKRYEKEVKVWQTISWMNDKVYDDNV
eukprot:347121_1